MSLSFDASFYQSQRPDVYNAFIATAGSTGLTWAEFAQNHYNTFGRFEGSDPSASFSTTDYLNTYPDVAAAGVNPFDHFLTSGSLENRVPYTGFPDAGNGFVAADYAAANPDLAAAGITSDAALYQHFVIFGQFEGRSGTPVVPPQTGGTSSFVFTANQDSVGSAFNQASGLITGAINTSTIQVSDDMNGFTGTLNATVTGGANLNAGSLPQNITGVTELGVIATATGTVVTTNLFSGLTTVTVDGSGLAALATDVVTFNGANGGLTYNVSGYGAINSNLAVNLSGGDTGATDNLTLNLNGTTGAGGGDLIFTGSTTAASNGGMENVTITSTGSNRYDSIQSDDSAAANVTQTVTIGGTGALRIDDANGINLVNNATLDASGNTGGVNLGVTAAGTLTATGTGVDDRILLDVVNNTKTVDFGAGTDTFASATIVATGGAANISNYEVFEVAGNFLQDADFLAAGISYAISATGATSVFDMADSANVSISATGAITSNTLELKSNTASDTLNVSLDGSAAQTIGTLTVDANTNGTVEILNIASNTTGGTVITTNAVSARDIVVTGASALDLGTLEATTTLVNATAATGVITVDGISGAATVNTGSGNDSLTETGSVLTANTAAGNDTIVVDALAHQLTTGDGTDTVRSTALAAAENDGTTTTTFLANTDYFTVTDFVTGSDTLALSDATHGGGNFTVSSPLAALEYVETTLAAGAVVDTAIEAAAAAAGIATGPVIAAIAVGSNVHIYVDQNVAAGGTNDVSLIGVFSGIGLDGIANTDINMLA